MTINSLRLPSFAKINLNLSVLGKRADGFHEICTIFQTVSLCDHLTISESRDLILRCRNENIPLGDENLIIKAAKLLREKFNLTDGADITLEKNIPAPGGLGGGSSNAATTLIGLIQFWKIKIDFDQMCRLGSSIGSDVPFFFCGGTAIGTGRGTKISKIEDYSEKYILIATPQIDVSTAAAFALLNALDLTNKGPKSILQICRDEADALQLRQSKLKNDFERVIFEINPQIARVKERLFSFGAKKALLSGSGASVFAFFDSDEKRQNALRTLQSQTDWRLFTAATVSHIEYQKQLGLDKIFAC